jgi:hypothetical protein
METIFKVNDDVYDIHYGWGKVFAIKDNGSTSPIIVTFKDLDEEFECLYTSDGRVELGYPQVLSFTEYTLEGFSQERPEKLPKQGQIVWTRGEFPSEWEIGHFFEKNGNEYRTYLSANFQGWNNKGIEITTINPYADEQ